MSKNPFYNAISALIYIILVVFIINWTSNNQSVENSLLMPILVLSLLTLSVAVMGYLFFYQPLMLYLDGKKEDAIKLFLKTVAIFAIIPISIFLLYFFNILI